MPQSILINDSNAHLHQAPPPGYAKGLIPRDFSKQPFGSLLFAVPFNLKLIPQSEWADRIAARKAAKAQLTDVRNTGMYGQPIPARDQNGRGYCWAHSGVSAHLVARAVANEPYADLSAYAVACIIKNYRDEGGNGIDGVEFQAQRGCPTAQYWPQQSMSSANDNANTWANAALHKYISWMELDPSQMLDQFVTCLLSDIPVVSDFNWWSHSVCTLDADAWDGKTLTTIILNSWGNYSGSDNGTVKLQGQKAIPDDAVACLVTSPSQI